MSLRIDPSSLTLRLLIPAILWMALVLSVGGILLSAAFRQYVENNFDQRLLENLDAMVGASELSPEGYVRFTRPLADQRFVVPYSGRYWQVSALNQEPFRSRSLWDQELNPDMERAAFTDRFYEAEGPDGQLLRVLARDIILPGAETVFRYLAAGDTADITTESKAFARVVARSLSGLGVGILAAMALQIAFGLHPLRGIRKGLATIRSGKAQRLGSNFPPEITPLVDEINALLDHNEKLVARARTQAGNLAHALKTPLSVIANEADAHPEQPTSITIRKQADIMRRQIDHHLVRARAIAGRPVVGVSSDVGETAAAIVRTLQRIYTDKNVHFSVECPAEVRFWGEREDLNEILGNILDNAAKWAKSTVRLTAESDREDGVRVVRINIEDDGPGVGPKEREMLFDRGRRLDETVPGSGLGLGIVRDIVEIYDGRVDLKDSELGGLKVSICLPEAMQA